MTWLYSDEVMDLFSQDEHWIDRHGVKHLISEMDDRYLSNLYRFVRRNIQKLPAAVFFAFPNFKGDMAQFYAEQAYDRMMEMASGWADDPDSCPLLAAIDRELADRAELVPEWTP
jgi:hypothetical protein